MGKITSMLSFPAPPKNVGEKDELEKYLNLLVKALYDQLSVLFDEFNGKIETVNELVSIVNVSDTGAANAEFEVAHNLGSTSVYYIPNINSALGGDATFYKGSTTWTEDKAYLKCTRANLSVTFLVMR